MNTTTDDTSEFSECFTAAGETAQPGPTLTVNTDTDTDDGFCGITHCTLREAINRANNLGGPNTIAFNIAGPVPHVIAVGTALPSITETVTIDGLTEPDIGGTCPLPTNGALAVQVNGAAVPSVDVVTLGPGSDGSSIRGLSITNASSARGIKVNSSNTTITCNYLGLGANGTSPGGNFMGVEVSAGTNNQVGGANAGDGNVAAHNKAGVAITGGTGSQVRGNISRNNVVGMTVTGNNQTVEANVITGNQSDGVRIFGGTTGNRVTRNSISNNGTLATQPGIELLGVDGVDGNDIGDGDGGTNNLQNFPVLARASSNGNTTVVGTLDSAPGTYTVELFSNAACEISNHGEGETFLGSVNVTIDPVINPSGYFSATLPAVSAPRVITATATDAANNTSEFSLCRPLGQAAGVTVTQSGGTTAVTEGSATGDTLQVRLNAPPTANVTIAVSANPAGQVQAIATLTFTPADWNADQPITVSAVDDATAEGAHTAALSFAASSTDLGYQGIPIPNVDVSIADNDVAGLAINDPPAVAEGDAGAPLLTFTITLTPPSSQVVTVNFATADGAAPGRATGGSACAAGVDYLTTSGTLTFQPNDTSETLAVAVCPDTLTEGAETVLVNLSGAVNSTIGDGQGVGTITDDDAAGTLAFSAATAQVAENGGSVILTVQRGGVIPAAPRSRPALRPASTPRAATWPAAASARAHPPVHRRCPVRRSDRPP